MEQGPVLTTWVVMALTEAEGSPPGAFWQPLGPSAVTVPTCRPRTHRHSQRALPESLPRATVPTWVMPFLCCPVPLQPGTALWPQDAQSEGPG